MENKKDILKSTGQGGEEREGEKKNKKGGEESQNTTSKEQGFPKSVLQFSCGFRTVFLRLLLAFD